MVLDYTISNERDMKSYPVPVRLDAALTEQKSYPVYIDAALTEQNLLSLGAVSVHSETSHIGDGCIVETTEKTDTLRITCKQKNMVVIIL